MIRNILPLVAVTACLWTISEAVPIILAAPKSVSPLGVTSSGQTSTNRLTLSPFILRALLDIDGLGNQAFGLPGDGYNPYHSYLIRNLFSSKPQSFSPPPTASQTTLQAMPSIQTKQTNLALSPLLLRTLMDIDGLSALGAQAGLSALGFQSASSYVPLATDGLAALGFQSATSRVPLATDGLAAYGGLTAQDLINIGLPAALNYPSGVQLFSTGYGLGGRGSIALG